MKKIFFAVALVFLMNSESFAASNDIYVRQDVFEVHMQKIDLKIDRLLSEMKAMREEMKAQQEEIKSIRRDINELAKGMVALSERVNGVEKNLGERINGLENRIGDLRYDIYLGLLVLGLIAAFPAAKEFFKWREERKDARTQSFTLEDVKRLIAESMAEARLR